MKLHELLEAEKSPVKLKHHLVYHATLSDPTQIREKGLFPRLSRFERTKKVFVTPSKEMARKMAKEIRDFRLIGKGHEFAKNFSKVFWVLSIDTTKMNNPEFYRDSASSSFKGLYSLKRIPPQAIIAATKFRYPS